MGVRDASGNFLMPTDFQLRDNDRLVQLTFPSLLMGSYQIVVSGSRRPARTPASSSNSRRAHAAASSPGASVPAGISHSVPPVA